MEKADTQKVQKILALAKDLASRRTDEGLDKAAEILLHTIDEGSQDPEVLVTAASYLLQGSRTSKFETRNKASSLVDRAVALASDEIPILEVAIHCYELSLNDFPEKLNDIIRLCLKVLDLDPEHIECMITLANYRKHPGVALSLEDTIRMLEWAHDIEPGNNIVDYTLYKLFMEAGEYEKAKKLYKQVMDNTQPNSKEAKTARHQMQSPKAKSKYNRYRKYGSN